MRKNTYFISRISKILILTVVPLTVILYILRGLGILSFLSGGVILFLIIASIFIVILFLIDKTY